ncbi:hypothetical protein, partial [uncultured Duncaniella sp.]|uniref:hypothetical protein n=1 Tax=uncultured Duncaniella sp. TaxID=2768039 RepID=UPI002711FBD0
KLAQNQLIDYKPKLSKNGKKQIIGFNIIYGYYVLPARKKNFGVIYIIGMEMKKSQSNRLRTNHM